METSPQLELLETLGDFTSKENWDKFFTIRGSDDAFEWYAEWPALRGPLLSELSTCRSVAVDDQTSSQLDPSALQILVPGCGSSRLSEHLYDAGFRGITNIDFSKVVISAMLRRNVRSRPGMRWRVMDMTDMQFADGIFDAAVDKGGLDALMEPKLGSQLGIKYVTEVKRVVRTGGKFFCLTLAELHVLGLLFSEFRFGWKTSIHAIPLKSNKKTGFQTFMVTITKVNTGILHPIVTAFDASSLDCSQDQGRPLILAIEGENKKRNEISCGTDILYSMEDLELGAKGDLKDLSQGRRCQLILGEQGDSRFSYRAVLLDSQQTSDTFIYHCGVFIVPKTRSSEWLFSSEEGQWAVVESSKAARLIMVFLDSSHSVAKMDNIQKDLSPLVMRLEPKKLDNEAPIPFLMASDGVKQRNIVQKVTSAITGPIIVEDVVYENDESGCSQEPTEPIIYRRLTFERSQCLVQSEAVLTREQHSEDKLSGQEKKKGHLSTKSKKKGSQRKNVLRAQNDVRIDYSYLASAYHRGILSGFSLIASSLELSASLKKRVKTIVVGLGAGLFPMCLRGCLPFLDIEVVELDAAVFDVARSHFGFKEDNNLKVHIADGIKFIQEKISVKSSNVIAEKTDVLNKCEQLPSGSGYNHTVNGNATGGLKILIVDADSSDTSSGLACPPENFLEEAFLVSVKELISDGGLFVINLVSRSTAMREMVFSRMKKVFSHLFYLELEEDVNDVLFALPTEPSIGLDHFEEMAARLQDLLVFAQPERRNSIVETARKIRHLK